MKTLPRLLSPVLIIFSFLLIHQAASGEEPSYPRAKVNFQDFRQLVSEVEAHRAKRLIDLNTFLEMSKKEGVVVLDTRSKFRYDRIHLKGAQHLNFSDFTQSNLARVIPSFDTTVLIYCNNNFEGNQVDFASKMVMPSVIKKTGEITPALQFKDQEKPLMMALNVPTYINLYGYGYRNVYELHELVKVTDPRVSFEGSIIK
jgi:rhodanese-related sulfurtransferase